MKISVVERSGVVRVAAEDADALVRHNAGEFRDGVLEYLTHGQALLISCSWMKSIDSAGVGAIVTIFKTAQRGKRRMVLADVQPQVLSIFKTIRLTSVLEIFDSEAAAFAALAAVPTNS
jgi:anti-anti-sigma factor